MFRALFLILLLLAGLWVAFHFFEGGRLPFIGGTLGDAKTTASVKAAFSLHRDLSRRPISVRTHDAIVALTGEVASDAEKSEAETIARSLDGVRGVDNLIAVTPDLQSEGASSDRTLGQRLDDTTLATKVKGAFALHRELKNLDISIDVREATVYLEGRVGTRAEAELAREWAGSIEGVRAVENLLQLTDDEESAEQLASRIESILAKNENLRGYTLRARAGRNAAVVLEGVVRTGAERELAQLLAERVAGSRELRNDIQIRK
jgi:osmotically-inducible protein OsmY